MVLYWLTRFLVIAMHAGKWRILAKDFTEEWVEYPIALASITIAKDLIFCNAIAKPGVSGP